MKKFKSFMSIMLCLTMLFSTMPMSVFATTTEDSFEGYTPIGTKEELNNIRNNLSGKYYLTQDIEFDKDDFEVDGDFYNAGRGWIPIGTNNSIRFTGVLDGNNHTIKGLIVNISDTSNIYAGLFGCNDGTIQNLKISGSSICVISSSGSAAIYTGGIAGYNYGAISDCCYEGSITASATIKKSAGYSDYVGGIVGYNYRNSIINNCYNNGDISVSSNLGYYACSYAGGISGYSNGTIDNCYNVGDISSSAYYRAYSGGIVGSVSDYGNTENCYNKGHINSNSIDDIAYSGGISGLNRGKISLCYNIGNIEATSTSTSAGYSEYIHECAIAAYSNGDISSCYYLDNVSNGVDPDDQETETISCADFKMQLQDTFAGFDFNTIWKMGDSSYPYPVLIAVPYNTNQSDNPPPDPDVPVVNATLKYGLNRFSFGVDITGYVGDVIDSLVVYTSANENIASLDIASSNTNVVEIGTIEIGVGDYITSENEHMATIPLKLKAEGASTITITSPEGISESVKVAVTKVPEVKKSIAVFTTEKSLSVNTGDSMWLAFGLMNEDTGLVEDDWRKMAITVSDPTIVSLSDYEQTEYGYSLEVIGKKEGATNVTITDTETGINTIIVISVHDSFVQTYSYEIDNMNTFYPNNGFEDHIATNIYDLNGMYVNNYNAIKNTDGSHTVTFDVYNSRYYYGAVDIYDENGMWLGFEEIKKYSDIDSVWDTGVQTFYLISECASSIASLGKESNLLTYQQASFSIKTEIEISVPKNGYFTISNNIAESPGTYVVNSLEILFDAAFTVLEATTSGINKVSAFDDILKETKKTFAQRLIDARNESLKNEVKRKAQKVMLNSMQSKIKNITKKCAKEDIIDQISVMSTASSELAGLLESSLFAEYKINWKSIFESTFGLGEAFFTKFSGPAGMALQGCFAITKGTNKLLMVSQLAWSADKPYVTIYSNVEEGYINPYGVVINTAGNMDAEAVLQVFRVSNDDAVDVILNSNNPLEKHELYNISFVKDDQFVQPSGKVTVHIPIPEGMNGNTCKVYRQESDGTWTILDAHIEDNYLVFETDHFSLYSVVGDTDTLSVHSLPNKVVYTDGDTLDTTGLVLDLNGELITEGFICDPTVLSGIGSKKITVQYGNASTDFNVEITEEVISNKCGDNLTYSYDTASYTLTISGEGDMWDWTYGNEAPWYSKYVETVVIEEGVTSIGERAFMQQGSLTSIDLPSSLKTINDNAFWNTGLTSITIPENVSSIGYWGYAFSYTPVMQNIYVDTKNDWFCSVDGVLFDKNRSTILQYPNGKDGMYDIPNTVTTIGKYAFGYTQNLTNVNIPSSVTRIDVGAFSECINLEKVTIPDTVLSLGRRAFAYCDSLNEVYILNNDITFDADGIFDGSDELTIYGYNDSTAQVYATENNIPFAIYTVSLSAITVYNNPTKTTYFIGDSLSTSGLKLKLTYSDGSTEMVTSGFTTSGFSSTSAGTKTVTVSYEGFTDAFTVTVKTPSITLSPTSKTMTVGDSSDITATTTPSGQTVTWTSSNTSVATISGGTITAKTSGSATITAKFTYNGITYTDTCTVSVSNPWCTISYDPNGGTGGPTYQTVLRNSSTTISTDIPVYEGYNFLGWSTSPTAKTPSWYAGSSITVTTDKFLYAVWEEIPEDTTSGQCGDNAYYSFDKVTGKLTISGTGDMDNWGEDVWYKPAPRAPWWEIRKEIKSIVICDGITNIGSYAFAFCNNVENISIPNSIINMGEYAIYECNIDEIALPSSIESIGKHALFGKKNGDCTVYAYCNTYAESYADIVIHENKHTKPAITATCTQTGYTAGTYCDDCDKYISGHSVIKAKGHKYDNACDTSCNTCGATRTVTHDYDSGKVTNKATCKATGVKTYTCEDCGAIKTSTIAKLTTHTYSNNCDKSCNVCGKTRTVGAHKYSNNCDTTCNYCSAKRTIKHTYTNACDTECNVCKAKRTTKHNYTNNCDISCNVCKATRTITHTYKTTTTKATLTKNGSIVKKCTVCGKIASKTSIKYAKTFKLSTTSYTYNGKVKTPTVTVKDSAGKTLKKNTDYTVTYASGRKNVGTYKVTVKMIGKYSGTKVLTFKINPAKISSYKLSATTYTYDGKVKTPNVTVKNTSGVKLTKNTHYTVTYASGRKNVGAYKVTIKGKGNYTGTKTLTFKINPAKTTVSKLTAGKKSITVAITKKTTQVTGYQIQYSTSKTFSKATTKTISSYKTTKYTLKSLSAKKTYYVRVRTYKKVGSTTYYSGWSTYKYVKTK